MSDRSKLYWNDAGTHAENGPGEPRFTGKVLEETLPEYGTNPVWHWTLESEGKPVALGTAGNQQNAKDRCSEAFDYDYALRNLRGVLPP